MSSQQLYSALCVTTKGSSVRRLLGNPSAHVFECHTRRVAVLLGASAPVQNITRDTRVSGCEANALRVGSGGFALPSTRFLPSFVSREA
jgi:hypothetical protein